MPEQIVKCPHKGGLPMTLVMKTAGGWQVRCTKCGRSGPIERAQADAIAEWNADRPMRWEIAERGSKDVIARAKTFGWGGTICEALGLSHHKIEVRDREEA